MFNSSTTQKQVFDVVGLPLVKQVLTGFNSTIFAYGLLYVLSQQFNLENSTNFSLL